ncbi:hypothetical protein [Massilia sp. AB1]|uniref:hypothetical protein n=1 Tax=Massilia sp. AB1 TaxID=2823371 RepID=UPI001B813A16|nr:hypothetical protein [Massilia sp. AB1]MBQ5939799.1 hypothetical protein [Massilia sp. AB1]
MNTQAGADLSWQVYNSPRDVYILFIKEGENYQFTSYKTWDDKLQLPDVIRWDPSSALQVRQPDTTIGAQSPALGLAHELIHFRDRIGTLYGEEMTTYEEIKLAQELGEPIRQTYSATKFSVAVTNTTASSTGKIWKATDGAGHIIFGPAFNSADTSVTVSNISEAGAGGSFENMWWEPVYSSGAEIFFTPKRPGGYWNPQIYPEMVAPSTDIYISGDEQASVSTDGYAEVVGMSNIHLVSY